MAKTPKSTFSIELGGLRRHRHTLQCISCKVFLGTLVDIENPSFLREAKRLMLKHAAERPDGNAVHPCVHAFCIHHVTVSAKIGMAVARLSEQGQLFQTPGGIVLGRCSFPKVYRQGGNPGSIVVTSDAELYLRISGKTASIHVLTHPRKLLGKVFEKLQKRAMPSDVPGRLAVVWEEIDLLIGKNLPSLKNDLVEKFEERIALAQMDAAFVAEGGCCEH